MPTVTDVTQPSCADSESIVRALARRCLLVPALSLVIAIVTSSTVIAQVATAPQLSGLGPYRGPRASRDAEAQRLFEQGVVMTWGFNPAEAVRAFEAAAAIDASCALCWWGVAWSLGPSINADMAPADGPRIARALAHARAAARTPRERRLVAALAQRHPASDRVDEEAYAQRMKMLAAEHARDAEVAFLAAEAILAPHPYDWWTRAGAERPWTRPALALLERAIALEPRHAGAHHYRIHVYESSPRPALARDSADLLRTLVPGSGHLLHMPAHIDMRTGRYDAAVEANLAAIAADDAYVRALDAQNAYRVGYVAHNRHFLWAAAAMDGRSALAMRAAREAWPSACGPAGSDLSSGILQHYYVLPLFALVRFGQWDAILRDTLPPDVAAPYPLAVWHYARGTAYAKTSRLAEARRELEALAARERDDAIERVRVKNINPARTIAAIARLTLEADIASAIGETQEAVRLLGEATRIEDALSYDEPHLWLAPTRHALGAAQLAAGRLEDAERTYRADLQHYPDNAWALAGLASALERQGKAQEAAEARRRLTIASARADVKIVRSRF